MAQLIGQRLQLVDYKPGAGDFRGEILAGLNKPQKMTPSKYFYDERGSSLFESICNLEEYYIPRTEISIMAAYLDEIAALLGPGVMLVEYGCGNCAKTQMLIDHLPDMSAYVPIDISREQLLQVSGAMASIHRNLEILPVCADYSNYLDLPRPQRTCSRSIVYFPGSSFGNFHPKEARRFLDRVGQVCGPGGGLLIGLDLKKDPTVLHRAYNDGEHVTADFNLNILERTNRELGADFATDQFEHYAFYNPRKARIEMHLISLRDQVAHINDNVIEFTRGESIWTESSYKYDVQGFGQMAAASGFKVEKVWTDPRQWFSVQYLTKI